MDMRKKKFTMEEETNILPKNSFIMEIRKNSMADFK